MGENKTGVKIWMENQSFTYAGEVTGRLVILKIDSVCLFAVSSGLHTEPIWVKFGMEITRGRTQGGQGGCCLLPWIFPLSPTI